MSKSLLIVLFFIAQACLVQACPFCENDPPAYFLDEVNQFSLIIDGEIQQGHVVEQDDDGLWWESFALETKYKTHDLVFWLSNPLDSGVSRSFPGGLGHFKQATSLVFFLNNSGELSEEYTAISARYSRKCECIIVEATEEVLVPRWRIKMPREWRIDLL